MAPTWMTWYCGRSIRAKVCDTSSHHHHHRKDRKPYHHDTPPPPQYIHPHGLTMACPLHHADGHGALSLTTYPSPPYPWPRPFQHPKSPTLQQQQQPRETTTTPESLRRFRSYSTLLAATVLFLPSFLPCLPLLLLLASAYHKFVLGNHVRMHLPHTWPLQIQPMEKQRTFFHSRANSIRQAQQ